MIGFRNCLRHSVRSSRTCSGYVAPDALQDRHRRMKAARGTNPSKAWCGKAERSQSEPCGQLKNTLRASSSCRSCLAVWYRFRGPVAANILSGNSSMQISATTAALPSAGQKHEFAKTFTRRLVAREGYLRSPDRICRSFWSQGELSNLGQTFQAPLKLARRPRQHPSPPQTNSHSGLSGKFFASVNAPACRNAISSLRFVRPVLAHLIPD